MPKTPAPKPKAAKPAVKVVAKPAARKAAAAAVEKEPRGVRRRRETRAKLLDAAFRLMAERGMDGVAINEITEAADVGFGSFYNHFESKEAIYDALVHSVFEEFALRLDELTQGIDDAAVTVSHSMRFAILRARKEPIWGKFLVREGYSVRVLSRGLGQFLLRDIMKGIAAKRFKTPDLLMSFVAVGSLVLGSISAHAETSSLHGPLSEQLKKLGLQTADIPERAAALALVTLGIPEREAASISRLPLPSL